MAGFKDESILFHKLSSSPGTPPEGYIYVYASTNGTLVYKDSAGVEKEATNIGITITLASISASLFNQSINIQSQVVTVSSNLQTQINNLDLNYATDAAVAATSANLQTQINNLDASTLTDSEVAAISSNLQNQIINVQTQIVTISSSNLVNSLNGLGGVINISADNNILVWANGDTIAISSSNYYPDLSSFVEAHLSASLQSQITSVQNQVDNLDLTYATDASVAATSAYLQSEIDAIIFGNIVKSEVSSLTATLQNEIVNVQSQVVAASSNNVRLLNGMSGVVNISADEHINIWVDGNTIAISASNYYPNLSNYATLPAVANVTSNLQTQIDNLDLNYATDASVAATSAFLHNETVNVQSQVVSSSASLQSQITSVQNQIDNLDLTYATDASVAATSAYLQSEIENIQTQVVEASSNNVRLLNGLSGVVNISAGPNIVVWQEGNTIAISGSIGGQGFANRVAYWSNPSQIASDTHFTWSSAGDGGLTAGNALTLNSAAASTSKNIILQTGGVNRWILRATNSESGSDSGSDLQILARTDSGGVIDTPVSIVRATNGMMNVSRPTTIANTLSISGDAAINGKLTVVGLIDPTGLALTPVAANPGASLSGSTIWVNSSDTNKLYFGSLMVASPLVAATSANLQNQITNVQSQVVAASSNNVRLLNDISGVVNISAGPNTYVWTEGTTIAISAGRTQPNGANSQIQFNNNGTFGSDTRFLYNQVSNTMALSGSGSQLLLGDGTQSLPAYSYASNPNSGAYRVGANTWGVATNGTLRLSVSTLTLTSTLPILGPDGSLSNPTFSFSNDPDSGMYSIGANNLGFVTGGLKYLELTSTGSVVAGGDGTDGQLLTGATDGFLYVPSVTANPTGTPTTITGFFPIVFNTNTNRMNVYRNGVWATL